MEAEVSPGIKYFCLVLLARKIQPHKGFTGLAVLSHTLGRVFKP